MADTAEAVAYQNVGLLLIIGLTLKEISAMLAGKLTEEDEDELEAELAQLQSEVVSVVGIFLHNML